MKSLSNFHVDGDWRVANAFGYLTIKKIKKIIIIKKANKIKKKKTFSRFARAFSIVCTFGSHSRLFYEEK